MFPVLIKIGSLTIYTYGFFLATGFLLALLLFEWNLKKAGLPVRELSNMVFYLFIVAFFGSKILMIFVEFKYYITYPEEILGTLRAGGHFFGALLFGIPFAFIYLKKKMIPFFPTSDVFAPSIALAHAFGRLGCFSAGCCYGREINCPISVTFSNPIAHQKTGVPLGVPLFPTQLAEAIFNFANFFFLFYLLRRKVREGKVFSFYILNYSVWRFIIEFFRGDPDRGIIFHKPFTFSIPQLISVMGIIFSIFLFFHINKERKLTKN